MASTCAWTPIPIFRSSCAFRNSICCVLGNLFDNAIEANDGLPEADRMIRVYMDMKGTQLYISFTNASSGGKQRKVGGASAPPNQTRGTVSGWSTSTRSSRLRAAT